MKIVEIYRQLLSNDISQTDLSQICEAFSKQDIVEIERLLALSQHWPPELEDMWRMMDDVWGRMGCDNKKLDFDKLNQYYLAPVWTLNGLFIENHDLSMQHRNAIADWIASKSSDIKSILDYGGGFGTLPRIIGNRSENISIDVLDPYPSKLAIASSIPYKFIQYVKNTNKLYDCLASLDVLEHVPDPLELFSKMISHVRCGGYMVIANNFYPVINCHLPSNFHLRYSFQYIARVMGLKSLGSCKGSHAALFQKVRDNTPNKNNVKMLELFSKTSYPILIIAHFLFHNLRRIAS